MGRNSVSNPTPHTVISLVLRADRIEISGKLNVKGSLNLLYTQETVALYNNT
jgi:hypothetical protein